MGTRFQNELNYTGGILIIERNPAAVAAVKIRTEKVI